MRNVKTQRVKAIIRERDYIAYIYRPRRRRNGKLIFARLYRARVRFRDEHKAKDIPLHVTEKPSAEQKLQQILNEHSQESVGLIAPKAIREAAETPLADHSAVYTRELVTAGCVKRYVQGVENYVGTLLRECKWEYLKDINAEAFQNWRQRQKKSPKTLNEYLVATRAFLKWAERLGYIAHNPLEKVELLRVQGRQKRARRAYTPEEIQSLLTVAGRRLPIYLMAMLTGIRRGEIKQLRWADVELDAEAPKITVPASISSKGDTQLDTQNSVAAGHNGSSAVTSPSLRQCEESPLFMGSKSRFVTPGREGSKEGKWSERQDLKANF
jgi:integrase